MEFVSETVNQAYCDLIYLLDHGYQKQSALNFVANHYNLNKTKRNILTRAALSLEDAQIISQNIKRDLNFVKDQMLHIDLYNQLTTFYSIIEGDPLIICRDGLIRDIFSSLHVKKDLQIKRELIISFLKALSALQPKTMILYFDTQRSHSKDHARNFRIILKELGIDGSCNVHHSVDMLMKKVDQGLILSHDSIILQKMKQKGIFDFLSWFFKTKYPSNIDRQIIFDFQHVKCTNQTN